MRPVFSWNSDWPHAYNDPLSQSPEHWDYSCPPMTGFGSAFVGENLRGCFQVAVMKCREPVKEEEGRRRSKAGP